MQDKSPLKGVLDTEEYAICPECDTRCDKSDLCDREVTSAISHPSFHVLRNMRNMRKHVETRETEEHSNYDLFFRKHICTEE